MLVIDYSDLVKKPSLMLDAKKEKEFQINCGENITLRLDEKQTRLGTTIHTDASIVTLQNAPIEALYAFNAKTVSVHFENKNNVEENIRKIEAPSATRLNLFRAHKLSALNLPKLAILDVNYAKNLKHLNAPNLVRFKGNNCPGLTADHNAMNVVGNLIFSPAVYAGKEPSDKALAVYNLDKAIFSFQSEKNALTEEFLSVALPLTSATRLKDKDGEETLRQFVEDVDLYRPLLAAERPQGMFVKKLQNT